LADRTRMCAATQKLRKCMAYEHIRHQIKEFANNAQIKSHKTMISFLSLKEPTVRELQHNCGTAAIMTTSFVLHNNRLLMQNPYLQDINLPI